MRRLHNDVHRLLPLLLVPLSLNCAAPADQAETAVQTPAATKASAPLDKTAPAPSPRVLDSAALKAEIHAAKGKVILLNFWATWCPPCLKEMPELAKLYPQYATNENFAFFSVSVDHPETIDDAVKPYLEKANLPFPVLVVSAESPDLVVEALGLGNWSGAVPATFIFDKSGAIVNTHLEEITSDQLIPELNAALN